jgi:polyisoprenoid-binding protein YceI
VIHKQNYSSRRSGANPRCGARTIGVALAATLLSPAAAAAAPVQYALDPNHASVYFAVGHNDISYVRGRFGRLKGTIHYDAEARTVSMVVSVPTGTVDTGNSGVDNVLRSEQFLDADRYPEVYFVANRLVFEEDKLVAIEGKLTLHGVERPLSLTVRRFVCKDVPLGIVRRYVCGGEFQAQLKRSDFGMTRFLPEVANEVELSISGEAPRE